MRVHPEHLNISVWTLFFCSADYKQGIAIGRVMFFWLQPNDGR